MTRRRRVILIVAGIALLVAVEIVVATRLWRTSVPSDLRLPSLDPAREFPAGELRRAESFDAFGRWTFLGSQVVLLATLAVYAKHGWRFARESAAGPIGTGFLLGMLGIGIAWLTQVPFSIADFWWAKDHGVTNTDWATFLFGDWAALGGQFAFVCFALLVAMGFSRLLRRSWWLPATAVFAGLAVLFAFVTPLLLDLHEPHNPRLEADAAKIARQQGVSGIPLKVEEVRSDTTAPNAFAVGLGSTRRVVLWDTIAGFPRGEVRVVIAHEYGHQARHHISKGLGWSVLFLLPTTLLVALLTWRRGGLARPEAVPLALLIVVVLQVFTTPLRSAISRHMEAEADWAALQTTRDPAAMRGLFRNFTDVGYSDPDPPGWFQTLFGDHPSGLQRIEMAEAWERAHPH
ncbi:MAG TPA: M48 family metalloprotease [Solirubrobacteraceae bacterium]|nr:M48 family metalloprotease [Solirubrobacteraceae bacterium]